MPTVEQIEAAILALPAADYRKLTTWLAEREADERCAEFEQDVLAGRLDTLAAETPARPAAAAARR